MQNLKGVSIKSVIFCISFRKFTLILQKNIGKAMVAEQNREKAKRRENGMKSNNQINIPQAREAMDKFKMQAASDLDVPVTY